ncbi:hypothetical protein [Bradyrhizobium ganzhouense]|uniref:hypothetical protein n=1 Tax=Bradyrhizobium ganzhouense TaxID=1179767 RepID=UPI003CEE32C4
MAIDLKAYKRDVEAQIEQIREDLAPLESGKMTVGEREGNGPWRDVTNDVIEHHKSSLQTYELILVDLNARIERGE